MAKLYLKMHSQIKYSANIHLWSVSLRWLSEGGRALALAARLSLVKELSRLLSVAASWAAWKRGEVAGSSWPRSGCGAAVWGVWGAGVGAGGGELEELL